MLCFEYRVEGNFTLKRLLLSLTLLLKLKRPLIHIVFHCFHKIFSKEPFIQTFFHLWQFSGKDIFGEESLKEKEEDDEVLKLALETHSKREEEGLRSNHALACVNLFLFF